MLIIIQLIKYSKINLNIYQLKNKKYGKNGTILP